MCVLSKLRGAVNSHLSLLKSFDAFYLEHENTRLKRLVAYLTLGVPAFHLSQYWRARAAVSASED